MTGIVAFDLDGTLIDCRKRQVDVASWAVRTVKGGWLDRVRFWTAKRSGLDTHRALLASGIASSVADAAATLWREHIEDAAWLSLDTVLPGAVTALAATASAGLTPVVITARKDADAVRAEIDRLGLKAFIGQLRVASPDRAALEKASYLHEVKAIALVGDSEIDANAAAAAGLPFFAVTSGQRSSAVLTTLRPDAVVDDVSSAVDCLLEVLATPNTQPPIRRLEQPRSGKRDLMANEKGESRSVSPARAD